MQSQRKFLSFLSRASKSPDCISSCSAEKTGSAPPSLEDFVARDDLLYHGALPLDGASRVQGTAAASESVHVPISVPVAAPATPNRPRLSPSSDVPPSPSPSPARQITPIPSPELARSSFADPASLPAVQQDRTPTNDSTLSAVLPLAHLIVPNPHASLDPFFASFSLSTLSELLRPSWDTYFMLLASLASLRSNCMKRRVGAVLVRDKRVVSTGYNGTPRGVRNCGEGGCGRCNSHGDGWGEEGPPEEGEASRADRVTAPRRQVPNREGSQAQALPSLSRVGEALDECLCLHAEENALLEAGRERVSGGGTEGAVLYCNTYVTRGSMGISPQRD